MKTSALKKILKEAVREVIQEELKDILLEAVKAPKVISTQPITQPVVENINPTLQVNDKPSMSAEEKRNAYKNILGETSSTFNSSQAQSFKPNPAMDTANGSLPAGEVDMTQIMGLMNKR